MKMSEPTFEEVKAALEHAGYSEAEVNGHLLIFDEQQETMGLTERALSIVDQVIQDFEDEKRGK
jgi:hypothetical protein